MAKKVIFGITWTWKKIVGVILGLLGIGTLVSCYGVVPGSTEKFFDGIVEGDIDGDGIAEPVEGIQVATDYMTTKTKADGSFEIYAEFNTTTVISFNDTDGAENGSFESKVVSYEQIEEERNDSGYGDDIVDLGTITLTPKE